MADEVENPAQPFLRVVDVRRFQYLGHDDLVAELMALKRALPNMRRGICESYEAMMMDSVVKKVIRRGEDTERSTRYGRGSVPITMNVISPTNPLQRQAFANVHQLMREGELQLPASGGEAKQLRLELMHLTKEITPAGNIRFEAGRGFHDDLVYALVWACYELRRERKPGGEWAA